MLSAFRVRLPLRMRLMTLKRSRAIYFSTMFWQCHYSGSVKTPNRPLEHRIQSSRVKGQSQGSDSMLAE